MAQRIPNRRTHDERGFSVVELSAAIVVVGLLLAVSIPSYLGLRDRAHDNEARAQVEAAVPAVEEYFSIHGSYVEMTLPALEAIDPTVALDGNPVVTGSTFCIQSTVGRMTQKIEGPGSTGTSSGSC